MPRPYSSAVITAPVDDVWAVVRDFNGLPGWVPAIEACTLTSGGRFEVGAVRSLTLGDDGGTVVETLVQLDDRDRTLTYRIDESPFPVHRYESTIRVSPVTTTNETFVEWWTEYDADAADVDSLTPLFRDGVFGAGLAGLQERFSS